jgi:hypothetical protein
MSIKFHQLRKLVDAFEATGYSKGEGLGDVRETTASASH